jgi:hypothetical protein
MKNEEAASLTSLFFCCYHKDQISMTMTGQKIKFIHTKSTIEKKRKKVLTEKKKR